MTMKARAVKISDLKARLSEHLRHVRRGHSLLVMDRDTPIAKVLPYTRGEEPLVVRQPLGEAPSLQQVPLPPPLKLDVDVVALLLEERQLGR